MFWTYVLKVTYETVFLVCLETCSVVCVRLGTLFAIQTLGDATCSWLKNTYSFFIDNLNLLLLLVVVHNIPRLVLSGNSNHAIRLQPTRVLNILNELKMFQYNLIYLFNKFWHGGNSAMRLNLFYFTVTVSVPTFDVSSKLTLWILSYISTQSIYTLINL